MKKQLTLLLTIILLLSRNHTLAQSGNTAGDSTSHPLSITFSPLALIDEFTMPMIQGGIEYRFSPRVSIHTELGMRYRAGSMTEEADTSFYQPSGIKLKAEVRFYTKSKSRHPAKKHNVNYMALNAFYIQEHRNNSIQYYYNKDKEQNRSDNFGLRRLIIGCNALIGTQMPVGRRCYFDCYAGAGLRFRGISSIHKEYDGKRDDLKRTKDVTITDIKDKLNADDSNIVIPHLTAGIRFCFRL